MGIIIIRGLQAVSVGLAAIFSYFMVKDMRKNKDRISKVNPFLIFGVQGITMFFDTLGIGAYAPQTALWKIFKMVPDRLIPGTLNVASLIPQCAEALIFITIVEVDPVTLLVLVLCCAVGANIGARFVGKFPEKTIELIFGFGLIIVAGIMIMRQLGVWPSGGVAIGFAGWKLIVSAVVFFLLGICTACGIGAYAPMMAICYTLGMSPRAAFPILFSSYTLLMPTAGFQFLKDSTYDIKVTIIGQFAGTIGVLLAAYLVKTLPLNILTWLVVCVLIYTSITMFISAYKKKPVVAESPQGTEVDTVACAEK